MPRMTSRVGAVLLILVVCVPARADFIWLEGPNGDAGSSLTSAQVTTGNSILNGIAGTLAPSPNIDMFKIQITDPAAFSATTSYDLVNDPNAPLQNGDTHAVKNTILFLFDSSGHGLLANDDTTDTNTLSTLPLGSAANLTPGIYYIAVSGYDTIPFYGNPNAVHMFKLSDKTAVVGSDNPNRTLAFWEKDPAAGDTGGYLITLTGAATVDYVPGSSQAAPAPASAILFGVGSVCVAAARWRRRSGPA